MIYGSSNATSALGSLLRKMQEETQNNPARVPQAAGNSSPIRAQIQGPLESPESIGSEKVVAMKPELAPSTETPSPVAATNIPMNGAAGAPGAGAMIGANPNGPVGPTNIVPPTSPNLPSGITSPTALKNNNPSNSTPGVSLPNASIGTNKPAISLSTTLLPSSVKNTGIGTKSTPVASPTPTPVKQNNTQTSSNSGFSMAIKELLPSILRTLQRSILGVGTIMQQSTINKAIERIKNGGRKIAKT